MKYHLKFLKHTSHKKAELCKPCTSGVSVATGCSRQITLSTIVKAKDEGQDFILEMCTLVDIPLEKKQEK